MNQRLQKVNMIILKKQSNLDLFNNCLKICKRHFKYQRPEPVTGCVYALRHFDDLYKSIFKQKWPSVRLGLLSNQKKVAVINNFIDTDKTENFLQSVGAISLKSLLEVEKRNQTNEKQNKYSKKSIKQLQKTMEEKMLMAENDELNYFYPLDKNVETKARFYEDDVNDGKKDNDSDYDLEEVMTSLKSDFSSADFDLNRLILPDSNLDDSLLHQFVPATKLRGENEFISESEYYKYYKTKSELSFEIKEERNLDFPKNLNVFIFNRGDIEDFPSPRRCESNIFNYYLMDGADLLTVLSLDVQPGDSVLDLCPKSGSMAFCILQTLRAKSLICNTNKNVEELFRNYLYEYSASWKDILFLEKFNYKNNEISNLFDKIIVDAECTDDRNSLHNLENNYFSRVNLKKRIQLPQYQILLLNSALRLVKPGGTVVYTTNTMSPVQNDGVVGEAIKMACAEGNTEFCIMDLSPALKHTEFFFKYAKGIGLKYGTLVVPFLPSNFGPKYFSKLIKKH